MSKIADNFFACSETPVNFPSGLKLADIVGSSTSVLRIISQIPGPGNYTGPHDFYFDINENPTTSIQFNGFMYNLSQSYLCMPGVHKIAREAKVCDAEIVILFKPSQTGVNQQPPILFCIPVESGIRINPQSQKYFSTLTTGVTANRPTLGSILQPKSTFITYNGFNFMLRVGDDKLKACGDIPVSPTNNVRYLVCQNAIGMAAEDYIRLNGQLARKPRPVGANDYTPLEQLVKPPLCITEISKDRFVQLTTRITNVIVEADDALAVAAVKNSKSGISTSALKCKPIRVKQDGGLLMDGKAAGSTLDKELAKTEEALKNVDSGELDPGIHDTSTTSRFQPGDIENGISIFLGLLFGVLSVSLIIYLIQKFVYGDRYSEVVAIKATAPLKSPSLPSLPSLPKFPDLVKLTCPKE